MPSTKKKGRKKKEKFKARPLLISYQLKYHGQLVTFILKERM